MENISPYIHVLFIGIALLTTWLFAKAMGFKSSVIVISVIILIAQGILAYNGFFTVTSAVPPRLVFCVMPPMLMIIILFLTKAGRRMISGADMRTLTLLQTIRIPVEIGLFTLAAGKLIPVSMTFEGNNFDIISGITAPIVYYFFFVKRSMNRTVFVAWNLLCIGLLLNVVIPAILSVPSVVQRFNFDQPNIAVLHFPFVWLAGFIVPVVFLSHLIMLRNVLTEKKMKDTSFEKKQLVAHAE